jgi:hypothetical protein
VISAVQSREIAHFCEEFLVGTRSTASPILKPENMGTRWNASLPDLVAAPLRCVLLWQFGVSVAALPRFIL